VEVCNSFEMSHKEVEGKIKIDMEYFTIKMEQCAFRSFLLAPYLCIIRNSRIRNGI